MSAPFSTSSLANSLNLRVSTPAARNAVLGIDGLGHVHDQRRGAPRPLLIEAHQCGRVPLSGGISHHQCEGQ